MYLYRQAMKIVSFLFLSMLHLQAFSQNLLGNVGFEDENICTEFHINCAPEAWICTSPSYIFYFKDHRRAHSGGHFMGLLAGHSGGTYKRTFIRSKLICGLQKGNRYRLSFFVRSPHPILDSAGIYFSSYDFLFEKRAYQDVRPNLYFINAFQPPVKMDTNWQQVIADYTANGEEAFVSFGYFAKGLLKGGTGIRMENNFLLFIDDITMLPLDPNEQLCPGWKKNLDSIYDQNERHDYQEVLMQKFRNEPTVIVKIASTIVPHVDTLIIPDILFSTGSAVLSQESHPLLDSLCVSLNIKSFDSLLVAGHTDTVGTLENNMKLSANRANTVANYLRNKITMIGNKLSVRFYAFSHPVAPNRTPEGRQRNRRVEIFVYRHK
jgi:outer membrane protein OmpA-like peptidoglycan-associated protein